MVITDILNDAHEEWKDRKDPQRNVKNKNKPNKKSNPGKHNILNKKFMGCIFGIEWRCEWKEQANLKISRNYPTWITPRKKDNKKNEAWRTC